MISRMLLVILFTVTLVFAPAPRAEAIDPVTIAILAPVALKVAQRASPYIIRSLQAGGMHMITMGKHLVQVFLLPIGVLQSTVGMPLGMFGNGIQNIVRGSTAPLLLVVDAIILPFSFFGVGGG